MAGGATPASQISQGLDFLKSSLHIPQPIAPNRPQSPHIPSLFTCNSTLLHLAHRFLLAAASDPMPIALSKTTIVDNLDGFS